MSLLSLPVVNVESVVASRLCQGCGACATSIGCPSGAIRLVDVDEVGIRPVVEGGAACAGCGKCLEVCSGLKHDRPEVAYGGLMEELMGDWGPVLEVWEGYAADGEVRFRGGSGGGATALGIYAVEKGGADGVLHIGGTPESPLHNSPYVSRSREELVGRTGSRYSPAAPASGLDVIAGSERGMVFMGKPCDVAATRLAAKVEGRLAERLFLTVSVFCGGTPSTKGTRELLKRVGIPDGEAVEVRYRGMGWPGMAGAAKRGEPGKRGEVTYREAWDEILTKHVQFRCKICPDGTGEHADISCGDPWYREIEPCEHGSTLFLVRTPRGREVFHAAMAAGYLVAERRDASVVEASQKGLLARRRTVFPKKLWMRMVGLGFPKFAGHGLFRAWWALPIGWKWSSMYRAARYALGLWKKGPLKVDARGGREWPKPVVGRTEETQRRTEVKSLV